MTAALTDRQRQVIETAERVGSRKKAAALLGMTEGALRGALSYALGKVRGRPVIETYDETQARIAREVAAGERCRVCWLLHPCCDHGNLLR